MDFKLLSSTEKEILFDGLTIIKVDEKTCEHVVRLRDKKTGRPKDVEIYECAQDGSWRVLWGMGGPVQEYKAHQEVPR